MENRVINAAILGAGTVGGFTVWQESKKKRKSI